MNSIYKKLAKVDVWLQEKQKAVIIADSKDLIAELNLHADQQIRDLDPDDPEDDLQGSQDLDDQEIIDPTNDDGNINPEQRSEVGVKRTKRVYESLADQRNQLKLVVQKAREKKNELSVGEDYDKDDFYFVWNKSKQKQWIVDISEEEVEEIPYKKLPSKLRGK